MQISPCMHQKKLGKTEPLFIKKPIKVIINQNNKINNIYLLIINIYWNNILL